MSRFDWFTADHRFSRYWSNGADQIAESLRVQPRSTPGQVRTLADMSKKEIRDLERRYGCPVAKHE